MAGDTRTDLTIVGLGPGDASLLTIEAREALASAAEVWLRTARHPTVASLPAGPRYESFDDAYERGASFDDVYEMIVTRVGELAARPQGVVYAVPGHPLFGEATVRRLIEHAGAARLNWRVIAGVSFLDVVAARISLDPLANGLAMVDALDLGRRGRKLVPQRPVLIAQVYDRRTASQVKLALLEAYPAAQPVTVIAGAGTIDASERVVPLSQLDHETVDGRSNDFDHLTTLYVPPLAPEDDVRTFEGLRAVVARLRDPEEGCPWDLEQTHETLKRFLLEEAYEALDALDDGDPVRLAEELGDLLMQVLLHAQVAEDNGTFAIEDVIASIATKLIRRHPHVFGGVDVQDADEVLRNWEMLKKEERGGAPLLDAVPIAMPALAQAQSVQSRAAKAGHSPPPVDQQSIGASIATLASTEGSAKQFGDLLFSIVALARERGLDAEEALRLAVRRFRAQVAQSEAGARQSDE